jgi:hypothetical protein
LRGKLKGKRPFGTPRFRREDDIRKDLREIEGKLWTPVDTVMNLRVP